MNPELSKEEAIFESAVKIADRTERARYVNQSCGDDHALRADVESLLACDDTAGDFLETPLIAAERFAPDSPAGTMIGPYEVAECVGEGGFGVVYRAHQHKPVQREVALKVMKLGMDTQKAFARFEAERQALAMMSHPNIATFLDVGATHSGRHYFAMEFVDGQPIDQYCDQQDLSLRERLELFIQVCRGVHHAHQKGLIHRDLKPANMLVTSADGKPLPKVIDFGIARAVETSNGEPGDECCRLAGTPDYMSPEQVMPHADIDTRADVFALGCVLYRLLVGVAPLELAVRPGDGFARVSEKICAAKRLPPSERLIQEAAAGRSASRRILPQALRGDLDSIIMKAISADRTGRYESASELALDLERYLSHQPVAARPLSGLYWASKLARRNRILVAAGACMAAAIIAGAALAVIGLMRAEQARLIAEAKQRQAILAAEKAEHVVQLLEQLVGTIHPDHGRPADYTVRQQLDDFAASLGRELIDHPETEARIRRILGRSYWSLGDMSRAGPHLQQALAVRERTFGARHKLTAQSRVDFARYLRSVSKPKEAEDLVHLALPLLRSEGPSEELVDAYTILAKLSLDWHSFTETERLAREAHSVAAKLFGSEHPTAQRLRIAIATSLGRQGEVDAGVGIVRDVLQRLTNYHGARHCDVASAQRALARILQARQPSDQRELAEAEELLSTALKTHRELLGEENVHVVNDRITLAKVLRAQGRHQQAEQVAREAIPIAERLVVERELLLSRAYAVLAQSIGRSDPRAAAALWANTAEVRREVLGTHPLVAVALRNRSGMLRQAGELQQAADCLQDELEVLQQCPKHQDRLIKAGQLRADICLQLGQRDEAVASITQAAAMAESADLAASARLELLYLLSATGQFTEAHQQASLLATETDSFFEPLATALKLMVAEEFAAAEEELLAAQSGANPRAVPRATALLYAVQCDFRLQQGRFAEAEELLLRLESRVRIRRGYTSGDLRQAVLRLIRLYEVWDKPDQVESWRARL